jgi:hypothetical protein
LNLIRYNGHEILLGVSLCRFDKYTWLSLD